MERLVETVDPTQLLEKALIVWRETRSPAVSAIIVACGVAGRQPLQELPPRQKDRAAALARLATATSDVDQLPLLEALKAFGANALPNHVSKALQPWVIKAPDPRVAALAMDLLERPAAVRELTSSLVQVLLACIETHGDVGFTPRLDAWWRSRRPRPHANIVNVRPKPPPAPGPVPEALMALLSQGLKHAGARPPGTRPRDGRALLDEIHEAPHDDGLRLAYADVLSEQGDPQGEYIALQINRARGRVSPTARKREDVLLAENRTTWLGALHDHVALGTVRFERGFLARCQLRPDPPDVRALWLLEDVDFEGHQHVSGQFRTLHTARAVAPAALPSLCQAAPQLREVSLVHSPLPSLAAALAQGGRSMRTLKLACDALPSVILETVLATVVGEGLESLTLTTNNTTWNHPPLSPMLTPGLLGRLPTTLHQLAVAFPYRPLRIELARVGARLSHVRIDASATPEPANATLRIASFFSGFDHTPFEHTTIHLTRQQLPAFEEAVACAKRGSQHLQVTHPAQRRT